MTSGESSQESVVSSQNKIIILSPVSCILYSVFCILSLIILLLSLGCSKRPPSVFKRQQMLMGTIVEITAISIEEEKADLAITAGFKEIRRLEEMMSTYIDESEISKVNREAGIEGVKVDQELFDVVKTSLKVSENTGGGFNIAVGPAIKLWDIGGEERLPAENELESIKPVIDYKEISLDEEGRKLFLRKTGMEIDLGGIAKGYAADRTEEIIKGLGIKDGIIAVAGDLKVFGKRPDKKPWKVGIRHPRKEGTILAEIELSDEAISTSGDYERYFIKDGVRYHHILDPVTLQPARECQSVTIIAKSGITADAYATGIFIMGTERGMELIERLPDIEGVIVDKDGKVHISSGLKGKVRIVEQ